MTKFMIDNNEFTLTGENEYEGKFPVNKRKFFEIIFSFNSLGNGTANLSCILENSL